MGVTALNYLYNDIMDAVVGVVVELKTVDVDLGQLKKGGESMPLDYPALLIRFENVAWRITDAPKQIGLVHVRLKVIYPFTNAEDYYTAVHTVREEIATFYGIIQALHDAINSITGPKHSKLIRFNENHLESNPDEMKWIYCIDYYCNIDTELSDFAPETPLDADFGIISQNEIFLENTIKAKRVG